MLYRVNGITLQSDQALLGFQPVSSGTPTLGVHFGSFPDDVFSREASGNPYYTDSSIRAWHSNRFFALRYYDSTEFLIQANGTEVWVRWGTASSFASASAFFTGPVFGLVLRMRGVLCLHASAIEAGEGAFAIAGPCGAGKSTLAASFATSGQRVFSDDVVALLQHGDAFVVQTSWARFKLWPDSVASLYGADAKFPTLDETTEKRVVGTGSDAGDAALPLSAVYLLAERSQQATLPSIESVDPISAMVELASHTYCNYLLTPEMRRQEFDQLRRLMQTITVRRLTVPNDFAALPTVRKTLLEDFAAASRFAPRSC